MSKADELAQHLNDLRKKAVAMTIEAVGLQADLKAFEVFNSSEARRSLADLGVEQARARVEEMWMDRDTSSAHQSVTQLTIALEGIERDLANMIRLIQEATQR